MSQPLAYVNGAWIDQCDASVPLWDAGFVLGASVSEQLRTFRGEVFRLGDHLARLTRSLEIIGLELPVSASDLSGIAAQLIRNNYSLIPEECDLGLALIVTPGAYSSFAPANEPSGPRLYLQSYPLPFWRWAMKYTQGEELAVSSIRQVPANCWPSELKCRSRMHYYLADLDVAAQYPGSRAVLTNEAGNLTETATSNLLASLDGRSLSSPLTSEILPGVTRQVVRELAMQLGIPWHEHSIKPAELRSAHEILLTSTPTCLLPVTRLDGNPVRDGVPGLLFRQLLSEFGRLVGVDIEEQARRCGSRELISAPPLLGGPPRSALS